MQIPKQQILDMITSSSESGTGNSDKAGEAGRDLPESVDTDNAEHQSLLQRFGVDPKQLLSKFGGGSLGL